jgi:hypothetical protein
MGKRSIWEGEGEGDGDRDQMGKEMKMEKEIKWEMRWRWGMRWRREIDRTEKKMEMWEEENT